MMRWGGGGGGGGEFRRIELFLNPAGVHKGRDNFLNFKLKVFVINAKCNDARGRAFAHVRWVVGSIPLIFLVEKTTTPTMKHQRIVLKE